VVEQISLASNLNGWCNEWRLRCAVTGVLVAGNVISEKEKATEGAFWSTNMAAIFRFCGMRCTRFDRRVRVDNVLCVTKKI